MRVSNWNPQKYDGEIINASMKRLKKAANVVADAARAGCPVGTISRPIYKTGPYAGQRWTARDAGALKKSIRVVERKGSGTLIFQIRNIRIYAGHFLAYYASIVEYGGKHFLRPALNKSRARIRNILENG